MQRINDDVAKEHKSSSAFELVDAEMEVLDHSSIGKLPCSKKQFSDVYKKLFDQPYR